MAINTFGRFFALRSWVIWTLGFLSFPLAGIAGGAIAGPVDAPLAAAIGGAVTGTVIGTGQWLTSSRRLSAARWIPATTIGLGAGLLIGATAVDFGTGVGDLALMGALTGVPLGIAQALALPTGINYRWAWAAAMPASWALGWTVTTVSGIDVERQYTMFGASGAVTVSALTGLLLHMLAGRSTPSHSAATPIEVTS